VLTDYHVHLRPDDLDATFADHFAAGNVERYLEAAAAAGVDELGVSEHVHRFREALTVWTHPFWREQAVDDLGRYVAYVREQTPLKLGIEMDFVPGREDRIENLLDAHEWDYVIGSVHFLRDAAVDYEVYDVWNGSIAPERIWRGYFETVAEAARSGLFDVMAHPDLVKVWGPRRPRPEGDLRFYYEPAVEAFAEAGVAVEVSTAGLRKPAGEIYPAPALLEMCVDAGCPVALSSDAHKPAHVGYEYERATELLRAHGVDQLAVFERRQRRLEPLS
jgi:histidinol-phosphatase (PHP family)